MSSNRLDRAADSPSAIAREATPRGDRVLWADRAVSRRQGIVSGGILAFGLVFTGIAAMWMALAFTLTSGSTGLWALFPYFAVPFLLVGLGIVFVPIWVRLLGIATVYALTDRHILVIVGRKRRTIRMIDVASVGPLSVAADADGSGNIIFVEALPGLGEGRKIPITGMYGVPRVAQVARQLERLRDGAARSDDRAAESSRA